MIKARLLLILVALLAVIWLAASVWMIDAGWAKDTKVREAGDEAPKDWLSATGDIGKAVIVVLSVTAPWPMFLAALAMLGFSFFRVYEAADGRLVYDPDNFYWKLMRWFYSHMGFSWKETTNLCQAFWMTAFAILSGLLLTTFVLMVVTVVIILPIIIYQTGFAGFVLTPSQGVLFAFLIGSVILMFFTDFSKGKKKFKKIIVSAWIAYAFALTIIVPVAYQMLVNNLAFGPALWVVAVNWGKVVLAITGALLMVGVILLCVLGVARSTRYFANTIIGRYASALKEGLCPILIPDINVEVEGAE